MPSTSDGRRIASGAVALALCAGVLFVPGPISANHDPLHEAEHDLAHALHQAPGNPIAYPLAHKLRRAGGDGTGTGGHVTVEGGRLYVGAYGLGFRMFDISDPEKPRP